jgi:hypothetical protein
MDAAQGGVGLVVPEPPQQMVGLSETEEVLGQGDLGDTHGRGPFAVGGHLIEGGFRVAFPVGPEVEVVVEHRVARRLPRSALGAGAGVSRPGG